LHWEKNRIKQTPNNLKVLSLSTAEQGCSLAIIDGTNLVCEEYWLSRQTHSRRIIHMIEHMMAHRANLSMDEMDAFVVAKGPGSFTGLRIGISVIKGLAYGLGKPAIGVSSLDGIAFQYAYSSIPVCVMMDARRDEVYSAVYTFDNGRLVSKSREKVVSPDCALENGIGHVLYAGSGSVVYKDIIEQKADAPVFGNHLLSFVSAKALVQALSVENDILKSSSDLLVPSYIRKSDAELQLDQKLDQK